jgi:hypothetical protein
MRVGVPQIQSGYFREEKSFFLLPENKSQFLRCSALTDYTILASEFYKSSYASSVPTKTQM